jgi:hypothetical protein
MKRAIIFIVLYAIVQYYVLNLLWHIPAYKNLLRYLNLFPPLGAPGGFQNLKYVIPGLIFHVPFAVLCSFLIVLGIYIISSKLTKKPIKIKHILLIASCGVLYIIYSIFSWLYYF